jgi:DNA-binding response OmpR family regulator
MLAAVPHQRISVAKLLIVDDDRDLCELWGMILRSEGHQVVTASDGLAGLRAYDHHRPDLVITDLQLPELHGLAIISRVRAVRPDAKIIAASADYRRLQVARALGASVALRKPVGVAELVAAVRWTLRERLSA